MGCGCGKKAKAGQDQSTASKPGQAQTPPIQSPAR